MRLFYSLTLLFVTQVVAVAQNEHPKKIYVDSLGKYYQQASMPVYIYVSTTPDGKPVRLTSDSKTAVVLEGHGVHSFKHENIVTGVPDEFHINADGIAPITTASFTHAPEFIYKGKQYYGKGLTVTLKATDDMSGLDAIYQNVNGAGFTKYAAPDFSKEGNIEYNYYAVDNTGNVEKVKSRIFSVDLTPSTSFHNFISISSENVISTNSTIYLTVSDNAAGIAKTLYKFDKEGYRPYLGGNIPFQYLVDGEHTITYYSEDNVANKEVEKKFDFYLDKTAPIMSADVLGDKFITGDRVYFSGRTKLKLTAVDNKSGIKEVMYTINNEPELKYTEPFYLPGRSGVHNIKFRAVDNTNNPIKDDFEHTIGIIYVDLTGPSISNSYTGPTFVKADSMFISPKTAIVLTGNDPEAGLKKLSYGLDNAVNETTFVKSFSVSTTGLHKLSYFGYDNVNNKNSHETTFIVDATGPEISNQFATPANKDQKYPSYVTIYLAGVDAVGVDQIRYSINNGKEQTYIAPLKGFVKNMEYTIKVTALDLLGNASQKVITFKTDKY